MPALFAQRLTINSLLLSLSHFSALPFSPPFVELTLWLCTDSVWLLHAHTGNTSCCSCAVQLNVVNSVTANLYHPNRSEMSAVVICGKHLLKIEAAGLSPVCSSVWIVKYVPSYSRHLNLCFTFIGKCKKTLRFQIVVASQ